MPYTIHEEKSFSHSPEKAYSAVLAAVKGLEGKILREAKDDRLVHIQFNKTIHGQVLGDRTEFHVQTQSDEEGTKVVVEAFPLDAVGRKLMFGARKGVTRTVLDWFWAHVEHNLKNN
jgi:hypothetical protein